MLMVMVGCLSWIFLGPQPMECNSQIRERVWGSSSLPRGGRVILFVGLQVYGMEWR